MYELVFEVVSLELGIMFMVDFENIFGSVVGMFNVCLDGEYFYSGIWIDVFVVLSNNLNDLVVVVVVFDFF